MKKIIFTCVTLALASSSNAQIAKIIENINIEEYEEYIEDKGVHCSCGNRGRLPDAIVRPVDVLVEDAEINISVKRELDTMMGVEVEKDD